MNAAPESRQKSSFASAHKTLSRKGYSIHYWVSGDPCKQALIFLHPAFGDHRCFDKQLEFFSKEYLVITIDLLGHGLSKVAQATDKIDASVTHMLEILQMEGKQAAHVVGVSMGSLIAQYFALNYPEQLLSLTLLGSYNINRESRDIQKAQRKEMLKWILKAIFSMPAFRKYVARMSVRKPEDQADYYEIAKTYTRKSFSVMSGLGKVLQNRPDIKRNYPLLLMVGEFDLEISKKHTLHWHRSDPTSQYCLLKNAGHCANIDEPADFNEKLLLFLRTASALKPIPLPA